MNSGIAIVGLACIYPDARSPAELWENVLAQRRAFRRLPSGRLREEDYFSADPESPDRTYCFEAAVIEGYEFDRTAFNVVGSTYRSADLAHWLALDVAARALTDAGFAGGEGLPRNTTGVLVGNSLTGEFSRANLMRLRWPYVRRTLESALRAEGWKTTKRDNFLEALEVEYQKPFPPVGEETLAGGLSNTIAGRICNQFDLKGGGYTVDGACASSLLAIANACSALTAGDLDVAMAGGVDLSLDPFELVGFAKTHALAPEKMRVYDARSAGFWPGEGCGMAVLMRLEDAVRLGRRVYAVVRGWGISSDGSGGITRPEMAGQLEALRRAYRRAGFGPDSVGYFEGHGTGTQVGDATELRVISQARRESGRNAPPAVVGTIKANIGHTKAAAGIAGFIKATLAVHTRVLPPTTGCEQVHPEIIDADPPVLRTLQEPESWRDDQSARAGVSAMGFGGINVHVVLEAAPQPHRTSIPPVAPRRGQSTQDVELFFLSAADSQALRREVERIRVYAARLSLSELTDMAAALARQPVEGPHRAAVVASTPRELADNLGRLLTALESNSTRPSSVADFFASSWHVQNQDMDRGHEPKVPTSTLRRASPQATSLEEGRLSGSTGRIPRLGFLFPGQGSPVHLDGGIFSRRFECVRELYPPTPATSPVRDLVATEVAQPAIATASLAGIRVLQLLGLQADVAVGHSLGEFAALHWAGAMDGDALIRIATARGLAMAQLGSPTGAMFAISADASQVQSLLNGESANIVGLNSPCQTVIAGEVVAVTRVAARAQSRGLRALRLPVSHAFHTPLVAAAAPRLRQELQEHVFRPLKGCVVSTVLGRAIRREDDLCELLCAQVTAPVQFIGALQQAGPVDLWLEVGPGQTLSGLVGEGSDQLAFPIDAGGVTLRPLLRAVAAAFVFGTDVHREALFGDRFTRPFELDWRPKFFSNPCELAPISDSEGELKGKPALPKERSTSDKKLHADSPPPEFAGEPLSGADSALDILRALVAKRAELPVSAVRPDCRLLSDLHLNSITVGHLVSETARQLGLRPLESVTDFASATVGKIADTLESLRRNGSLTKASEPDLAPAGIESWIRPLSVEWVPTPAALVRPASATGPSQWQIIAPKGHTGTDQLIQALSEVPGSGVVVCLPKDADDTSIQLLLDGARAVLALSGETKFVLVQSGWRSGSFARSLHLEALRVTTCVVEIPPDHPESARWIADEAAAATGHVDVRFDASGNRFELKVKCLDLPAAEAELPLNSGDVLLVTGGGKGIAAECAWQLERRSGVRLVLLGRSAPSADAELAANLSRLADAGVRFCYRSVDIVDEAATRIAIANAERELGPVTAILHAAGINQPQSLATLDEAAFLRTLAPKFNGLQNVLAAVGSDNLRLLVTFGSIIGRSGLQGQADYAVANEWQTQLTELHQASHPHCRCLALEWSVWSNLGMGARLGRVESLRQLGITPISPEIGADMLVRLLSHPLPEKAVIITGRFGNLPTLSLAKPDRLPSRFLERIRVYYPGIELVAEADLSAEADPYLNDHVYHGELLFPAVLGLEAIAQVAMTLAESRETPRFEDVELSRPVVAPHEGTLTIRLVAFRRSAGVVEVALRSAETGFQTDHFRATCHFGDSVSRIFESGLRGSLRRDGENGMTEACASHLPQSTTGPATLPITPAEEFYGPLFFHTGRFQCVRNYRRVRAQQCIAELARADSPGWFGAAQSAAPVLGDAGLRDAAIHAIQACIPHARLLPTGVRRIQFGVPSAVPDLAPGSPGRDKMFLHAREVARDGDTFLYDLELRDPDDTLCERWEGLRLRKVEDLPRPTIWNEALLGAYWERRVQEIFAAPNFALVFSRGITSTAALEELGVGTVTRRADGKPEPSEERQISAAHSRDLVLAVARTGPVGCDLEPVEPRPREDWLGLLGSARMELTKLIATEEDFATAATRVWVALECLKKAGLPADSVLTLDRLQPDGTVLLRCGRYQVASFVERIRGESKPIVMGVVSLIPKVPSTNAVIGSHSPDSVGTVGVVLSPPQPSLRAEPFIPKTNGTAATARLPDAPSAEMPVYEYPLTVSFEDTNVVGNVYFANYIRWQGKVREQFLCDHAPAVLDEMRAGLELLTLAVDSRFYRPLFALDRVVIRMRLDTLNQNSARMSFDYVRKIPHGEELVAQGSQEIGACRLVEGERRSVELPRVLVSALGAYSRSNSEVLPEVKNRSSS